MYVCVCARVLLCNGYKYTSYFSQAKLLNICICWKKNIESYL